MNSLRIPACFFTIFETECSATECTYSFGTAKERWKNDICWDEVGRTLVYRGGWPTYYCVTDN